MIDGEYWLTGDAYSTFADGDVGDYNHAMYAFGSAIGLDEDQLRKLYDAGVEADANGIDFRAAAKAWIKENLDEQYHELDWTDPSLLMAIREQDAVLDCMKEFVGLFGPDIESHCTDEDVIRSLGMAYLLEAGADEAYLKWYLSDPQGDPRDYAIEHMGWIRVDSDSFQAWKFTDSELSEIRSFDGWPEDDDDGDKLRSSLQEVGIEELSTNKHFSVPLRMLFDEQLSAVEIVRLMENDEALEKYERANKHYEGEEHEHLSLNPPGRSSNELGSLFFEELEKLAGHKQLLFVHPYVLVGDRKGDILGRLELSFHAPAAEWKIDGISAGGIDLPSVRIGFIGVEMESRQRGNATRLMNMLCTTADRLGLAMNLSVSPQAERGEKLPPMNKKQLAAFYKRFGFKPTGTGMRAYNMLRTPRG